MNPTQSGNPGSFNAPAGGSGDVLQDAMARRGFSGVTNQMGPSAPAPQNAVLPSESPPLPPGSQAGVPQATSLLNGGKPVQDPNAPAPHGNNPEAMIALKALSDYLKGISVVNGGTNG